ncbi:hypothetical protein [Kribbella antiqua]|uniref:hypothetical protein n=1 Tax=Kribbella antiqua TaxID=2512217 RepID=UPI00104C9181|nr:hypothetical protein [Kribbella antiqua]
MFDDDLDELDTADLLVAAAHSSTSKNTPRYGSSRPRSPSPTATPSSTTTAARCCPAPND